MIFTIVMAILASRHSGMILAEIQNGLRLCLTDCDFSYFRFKTVEGEPSLIAASIRIVFPESLISA